MVWGLSGKGEKELRIRGGERTNEFLLKRTTCPTEMSKKTTSELKWQK